MILIGNENDLVAIASATMLQGHRSVQPHRNTINHSDDSEASGQTLTPGAILESS